MCSKVAERSSVFSGSFSDLPEVSNEDSVAGESRV
jgi:hypothetical protein